MIKYIKNKILLIVLIYLSAFMLISPQKSITAVISSIELCGKVIIPTLFPFIFCSNLFISLGAPRMISRYLSPFTYRIFGVSGGGTLALILGMLCGYPIGAVCVSSLYKNGECSKNEAERLISYCNNAGPMFVISAVGVGILSNYKAGITLYLIQIFSALIYGVFLKFFRKENSSRNLYPSHDENNIEECVLDIGNGITQSIETIFKICGFIIIFSVITAAIPDSAYKPYISAFLEISAGIKALVDTNLNQFTLPLISAFLSFSGISVLAQVSAVVSPLKLSLKHYIIGKSIQGTISFTITFILMKAFPNSVPAFSSYTTLMYYVPTEKELIYSSLITIIFAVLVVLLLTVIAKISEKFD